MSHFHDDEMPEVEPRADDVEYGRCDDCRAVLPKTDMQALPGEKRKSGAQVLICDACADVRAADEERAVNDAKEARGRAAQDSRDDSRFDAMKHGEAV